MILQETNPQLRESVLSSQIMAQEENPGAIF